MANQIDDLRMVDWFWMMLGNAELDGFTDEAFYALRGHILVDKILNRILDRTYKRDGIGGLFPLKHPKKDQRRVELWYQMNAYLVENYYSEDLIS
jgi:hypothetical protein